MSNKTIKAECTSCGGTGLYSGMCEGPGLAVVCLTCSGTGRKEISYTPFTQRKFKKGIKFVQRSRGTFILTGVGGFGDRISYEDFTKGKLPK